MKLSSPPKSPSGESPGRAELKNISSGKEFAIVISVSRSPMARVKGSDLEFMAKETNLQGRKMSADAGGAGRLREQAFVRSWPRRRGKWQPS
jgi:hypothetical protein